MEKKAQAGLLRPSRRPPAPVAGPTFGSNKQQVFQPVSMNPALVRQSMQARSEYDTLNRRIMARQQKAL